jgi:hypothetical protein
MRRLEASIHAPRGFGKRGVQVVFVQELALVPLLAEAPQPVFADEVVGEVVGRMLVRAGSAQGAMALAKRLANLSAGIEAEAILLFEEVIEGEVVFWWRSLGVQDQSDGLGSGIAGRHRVGKLIRQI